MLSKVKTYVISLNPKSRYFNHFNDLQYYNPFFYTAVKPNSTSGYNVKKFISLNGRKVSLGEIGCLKSHIYVNKLALRNTSSNWSLILEDDALIDYFKLNNLFSKINEINNDFPIIILLGHSKTKKSNLVIQRLIQPLKNNIVLGDITFGLNKKINRCGTVGYLINDSASEIFLDFHDKFNFYLADDWKELQVYCPELKLYHPYNPIIYEDLKKPSSTGNNLDVKHNIFSKNIFNVVGAIFKNQIYRLFRD